MDGDNTEDEWKRSFVDFPKFSFDPVITRLVNDELTEGNRLPKTFSGEPAHVLDNYPGHLLDWVIRPRIHSKTLEYCGGNQNSGLEEISRRPIWKPPDPLSAEDLVTKLVREHGWRLKDFKTVVDRLEGVHDNKLINSDIYPTLNTDEKFRKLDNTGLVPVSGQNNNTLLGTHVTPIQAAIYKQGNQDPSHSTQNRHIIDDVLSIGDFYYQSNTEPLPPLPLVNEKSKTNISYPGGNNLDLSTIEKFCAERIHRYNTEPNTKYKPSNNKSTNKPVSPGSSNNRYATHYIHEDVAVSTRNALKRHILEQPSSISQYNLAFKQNKSKARNDIDEVSVRLSEEPELTERVYSPIPTKSLNFKEIIKPTLDQQVLEDLRTVALTGNFKKRQEQVSSNSPNRMRQFSDLYYTNTTEVLNDRRSVKGEKTKQVEYYKKAMQEETRKPQPQLTADPVIAHMTHFEKNEVRPSNLNRETTPLPLQHTHNFFKKLDFESELEAPQPHTLSFYDGPAQSKISSSTDIFTKVGKLYKKTGIYMSNPGKYVTDENINSLLDKRYIKRSAKSISTEKCTINTDSKNMQSDANRPNNFDSMAVEKWKNMISSAIYSIRTNKEHCKLNEKREELADLKSEDIDNNSQSISETSFLATTASKCGLETIPEINDKLDTVSAGIYIDESKNTVLPNPSRECCNSSLGQNKNEIKLSETTDISTIEQYERIKLAGKGFIKEILNHNLVNAPLSVANHAESDAPDSNFQSQFLSIPEKNNENPLHNTVDSRNRNYSFTSNLENLQGVEESQISYTEKNNQSSTSIDILGSKEEFQNIITNMNNHVSDGAANIEVISRQTDSTMLLDQCSENNITETKSVKDQKYSIEAIDVRLNYEANGMSDSKITNLKTIQSSVDSYQKDEPHGLADNQDRERNLVDKNTGEFNIDKVTHDKNVNTAKLGKECPNPLHPQLGCNVFPESLWYALKIKRLQEKRRDKISMNVRKNQGVKRRTFKRIKHKFRNQHRIYDYRPQHDIENLWHHQITASRREKQIARQQDKEMVSTVEYNKRPLPVINRFNISMPTESSITDLSYPQAASIDHKSAFPNDECTWSMNQEVKSACAKESVRDIKMNNESEKCCIM